MTLLELQRRFTSEEDCATFLRRTRWPNGVRCPRCHAAAPYYTAGLAKWECRDCRYQFTLTSGTIFHATRTPLRKWFIAIWLVCASKRGISGKQLQRVLGVTYKTAWRMAMQIRLAMLHGSYEERLCTTLTSSDTATSGHPAWRRTGRGLLSGVVSFDLAAPGGEREAIHVGGSCDLQRIVAASFRFEAELKLSARAARGPRGEPAFVQGCVGEAGSETPLSLLKRAIFGVYHRLSSKYFAAYLAEFAFRFSHRDDDRLFEHVVAYCWR